MELEKISAIIHGEDIELQVYDTILTDPSCNQWEAGWSCHDPNTDKVYFVSESGIVWLQPANVEVGCAPEIEERAEQMIY